MYTIEEVSELLMGAFILGAVANDRWMIGVVPKNELDAAHAICDILEAIETFAGACHDL
jgi:hypothetical protein